MSDESFEALEAALFGDNSNSVYGLTNENARLRYLLQNQQAQSSLPSPPVSPSAVIDFTSSPYDSYDTSTTGVDLAKRKSQSTVAKRHASELSALRASMVSLAGELETQRAHGLELCVSRREGEAELARLRTVVATSKSGGSSNASTPAASSTPRRTATPGLSTTLSSRLPTRLKHPSSSSSPGTSLATLSSSPVKARPRTHTRPPPIETKISSILDARTSALWESKSLKGSASSSPRGMSPKCSPPLPSRDELPPVGVKSRRSMTIVEGQVMEDDRPPPPCNSAKRESTSPRSRTQQHSDLPPLPPDEEHMRVEASLRAQILVLENRLAESEEGRLASDFCAQSLRDYIASQALSAIVDSDETEVPFVSSRSRWGSSRRPSKVLPSSSDRESSSSEPSTPTDHLTPRSTIIPLAPSPPATN